MSSKFDYTQSSTLGWEDMAKSMLMSRRRLAADPDLSESLRAWKVWSACVEQTAGWRKRSDRVNVSVLVEMSGVRRDYVKPILEAFDARGIFSWTKKERSHAPGLLSLPSLTEPKLVERKPKQKVASPPRCPDHPDIELWLNEFHDENSVYVAKIVNPDGTAWCCAECTDLP
jgi:hypothetical protein